MPETSPIRATTSAQFCGDAGTDTDTDTGTGTGT